MSGTVLVTGATGFIGSRLTQQLIQDGQRVIALVRPESDVSHLEGAEFLVDDGSIASIAAAVSTARPDTCFHLATRFIPAHTSDQVLPLVAANIELGTRLAEALLSASPSTVLVNVGTAAQHYESRDYGPLSLYAATKQAMADILTYYAELTDLSVITLSLYDTYGVGDTRTKIVQLLARATLSGETLLMSPGAQLIDLLYVDDVVQGLLATPSAALPNSMANYAIRSGAPLHLTELVQLFESVSGRTVPVIFGARPYRDREMLNYWDAGLTLPRWSPEITLTQGIERIWEEWTSGRNTTLG